MKLNEIVDIIYLEAQSIDSIFRNKPRYLMSLYAKEGMSKLNLTFGLNIIGMNFRVPSSCTVYKPQGYEAFVRAYIINCNGRTIEIDQNKKIPNELRHYITNCDGTLIGGCEGEFFDNCLDCNNETANNGDCHSTCNTCNGTGKVCPSDIEQMLLDLETYKDSWIKIHKDRFEFSSDLEDVAMVIEYISNQTANVEDCAIDIDDKYAEALQYYIKFKLLENGQNTLNQAQYFRRLFKSTRDNEIVKSNPLTKNDLLSILNM
ncbi:hypothetical protein PG299_02600 [Riemerella anatipestifer]|nr:hypothetical protein [Riemerella anatipestifer]